jgi:RNA polymerase sigma-70 factor (ECF subfamily)
MTRAAIRLEPQERIPSGDHPTAMEKRPAISDSALVVAIARGSEQALEEIYRRHAGALYSLGRRVTRNDDLAAEIVQEIFVRLWATPERFDPERGSLRAFLLADVHGRAVDAVRSEVARRRREERELLLRPVDRAPSLEDEAVERATSRELRESLDGLAENERRAIELAYFGGHSYREVARLLGEPEGTVKSRIRNGLLRLRAELPEVGAG